MSILPDEIIGLEVHPHLDRFFYLEDGRGNVWMGSAADNTDWGMLSIHQEFVNTGYRPAKLFSVHAAPAYPHATLHETKEIAE